jgi:hypothetical protein
MLFILPSTNDLGVWKRWQKILLFADMVALYSMWKAVEVQGGLWTSEEVGDVTIIAAVTVVRLMFVAGVGVSQVP